MKIAKFFAATSVAAITVTTIGCVTFLYNPEDSQARVNSTIAIKTSLGVFIVSTIGFLMTED